MSEVTKEQIEDALKLVVDPYTEQDPVSGKTVKKIDINDGKVEVKIVAGYPNKGFADEFAASLKEKIMAVEGVTDAAVDVSFKVASHGVQKAALVNLRFQSTWHWHSLQKALLLVSSTPISMVLLSRACSVSRHSRNQKTEIHWSR